MSQPSSPPNSQSQPSSSSQTSSQFKHKELALEGGTMTVVGLRKKRQKDRFMTLELEFSFTNEKKPRGVGNNKKKVIVKN